jgi:rare lipoprotein A (peptidoglycan hydrolase)
MRLLALLTGMACAALPSVSALAATGGAAAPTSAPTAPAKHIARSTSIATWFGPGFYGKRTVVGVANRTLPCGTLVKVSYNGHAVTVPVLDRGPYSNGADWDLTAGAAQALNVTETVRVATRVVGAAPNTPALGLPAVPASPAPAPALAGGAIAG